MRIVENIPEKGHYDVIVVGGGVAGVAAAVAAGREGRKVLLVEKAVELGGLATQGLIHFFVPMCNGRGKQIIFGMAEEFLRLSIRYGYGMTPEDFVDGRIPEEKLKAYEEAGQKPPRYMTTFSPEIFSLLLTELCVQTGVKLLFDTVLSRPVADDGRIQGIVVENKSGRSYYSAELFIDASGDGDLMYRAGVPTVERGNFHTYMAKGLTLENCRRALELKSVQYALSNCAGGNADLYGGGQPEDVALYYGSSNEEINRYLIDNQLELLAKYKNEEERLERDIVRLPGMCQFRTTRRIDGDYVLRTEDAYRHFEDSVGAICDFDRRDFLYEVPYRTLGSREAPNLITCGRCAAGDGYAWDVLRVIPPAILTGQAAGLAAAQAIDEKKPIWDIDIRRLQEHLAAQNVMIHFDDADVPLYSDTTVEHND